MSMSKLREIVKDREAWCAVVHGLEKSQTRLNDWATTVFLVLGKHRHEMQSFGVQEYFGENWADCVVKLGNTGQELAVIWGSPKKISQQYKLSRGLKKWGIRPHSIQEENVPGRGNSSAEMLRQECIPSASKRNGRQQARERIQMELGPWCLLGLWCLHWAGRAALEGVECSDVAHLISF